MSVEYFSFLQGSNVNAGISLPDGSWASPADLFNPVDTQNSRIEGLKKIFKEDWVRYRASFTEGHSVD